MQRKIYGLQKDKFFIFAYSDCLIFIIMKRSHVPAFG